MHADDFVLVVAQAGDGPALVVARVIGPLINLRSVGGALPEGIGLSIGAAAASEDADDLTEAIREADSNMYRDKLGERALGK